MKPVYHLTLSLSIRDASALWSAAAAHALAAPGATMEDVVETIGPREDPNIDDCLMMLADVALAFGGSEVEDMMCVAEPPSRGALRQLPRSTSVARMLGRGSILGAKIN